MESVIEQIVPIVISVISAIASFLIVFFKTRTKVLEKKLSKDISDLSKEELIAAINNHYSVVFNDKIIQLKAENFYTQNELVEILLNKINNVK